MKAVYGEIQSLRASQRSQLEKLSARRVNPRELLNADLARRAGRIAAELGQFVGLLISRDGRVSQVVVGTKNRIYLPDLGRYRLDKARLRRLRLLVFVPDGERICEVVPRDGIIQDGRIVSFHAKESSIKRDLLSAPIIQDDLRTDLEKLRFDALAVVSVSPDGEPGALTTAHLEPVEEGGHPGGPRTPSTIVRSLSARNVHELSLDFSQFIEDLESRFTTLRTRVFDTSKEQAVLIGVYTERRAAAEASMTELEELARTAGIEVADAVMQRRRALDPKTVVGKGKLEDIVLHCLDLGVDLLVFDRELSPGQLRSITNLTELRVIDRSMLILDIFALRAKSSEGRLQVELAQLKYSLPRLTETDTGLSRLTGGIGGRGPGETKLEIGRRRARDRIALLEKKIDQVATQRGLRRERRQSRGVPVIAIVGYTNAGKSTLLNALTKGDVFVEGKLFATLDPASRRMRFPNEKEVVFVDTVGFIRELPKELVNAFRATLEEVGEADLLLHVVDGADPEMRRQVQVVVDTLEMLGFGEKPRLLVINKIDLLSPIEARSLQNSMDALGVSAKDRVGFHELIMWVQDLLVENFEGQDPGRFLELPPC